MTSSYLKKDKGDWFILIDTQTVTFIRSPSWNKWLYQAPVKYQLDDGIYIGDGYHLVICGLKFTYEQKGRMLEKITTI